MALKTRSKGDGGLTWDKASGVWRASIELPPTIIEGKVKRRRKVVSSKDKRKAMQKLRAVQKELAEHGDLATSTMTTGAWLDHWIDSIAPRELRPKTQAGYRSAIKRQIKPRLGPVKLDNLTAPMIRSMTDEVAANQKPSYAAYCHAVMSSGLSAAIRDGKLTRDVMAHMRRPRYQVEEQAAFAADQAMDLLSWLSSNEFDHKTPQESVLYATYLLTGARRNEVLGLEVDRMGDVLDLSWQLSRIRDVSAVPGDYETRHITGHYYWARPKSSKSWRIIPLVDPLRSILSAWVESQGKTGLVFEREPGLPLVPDTVTDRWPEIIEAAGLQDYTNEDEEKRTPENERVKLHGCRHTVVDLLYEAGVPEHIIQDIMGQSTRRVTRDYRSKRGKSKAMVEAMEQMVGLLEGK